MRLLPAVADLPAIEAHEHPVLGPSDVHIWRYEFNVGASLGCAKAFRELLSPDELDRLARLRDEHSRQQFVAGRALCRWVLSRYAPVRPEDWRFELGSRGKPSIADPVVPSPLWFSLSHAKGMSVCAVTGAGPNIGIDLERVDSATDYLEVASQFFPEVETNALRRLPPDQQSDAFIRTWVLKESFAKARETSLADGFAGTAFHLGENGDIGVTFMAPLDELTENWQFRMLRLDRNLIFALSVRTQAIEPLRLRTAQCIPIQRQRLGSRAHLLRGSSFRFA